MKVAVAQVACQLGDIAANAAKIAELTHAACVAGAQLVVFPEMVDIGYHMPTIQELGSGWEEGVVPATRRLAQSNSIGIVAGVSERVGANLYNTQIVVGRDGEITGKYRKTHLFNCPPVEEGSCFRPGADLVTVRADGLVFGLSICYDLRFPEFYRSMRVRDSVDVFLISSAWPFPRVEHMRTLAVARAIENQAYVVLANRVGTDSGTTFCGNSVIIDPYGVTLAAASADHDELLVAEIERARIDDVRARMPVVAHRRIDLYG